MKHFFIFVVVCVLSGIALPLSAEAAEMYLVLDKTQVTEQGTFSGTVYVSTGGVAINNAESTLHFPTDLISVDSVSIVGSIFNIWVEQPTYSNTAGTVYFNGGLPTPGYSGEAGNSLRINFRAKKSGTANITFGTSAIRANDGKGTDVLTNRRGGSIAVTSGFITLPQTTPVVPTTQPQPVSENTTDLRGPAIVSEDMPNQDAWYNKTTGNFSWALPEGITTVQLILSRLSSTVPTVIYEPPIKNKTLSDLSEGILYLNGRFKDTTGWSRVSSRKIQIDLTEPESLFAKSTITKDDTVLIEVSALDTLSGIKSYTVYDGEDKLAEEAAHDGASVKIQLPPLQPGTHSLTVRVYDNAENYAETKISVDAPTMKPPRITQYPQFLTAGSKIEITGTTPYSDGVTLLWIKEEKKETLSYPVSLDAQGTFTYTTEKIKNPGIVSLWAETIREGQTTGISSEKVYIDVEGKDALSLGTGAIQIVSLVITLLVLLFGVLALIYLGMRKLNRFKRTLRRDLIHTEREVHKIFKILKSDTKRHLTMLERARKKRKLTREENKIFTELSENLDETEQYLAEKIQNIEEQNL